jgi:hypothetical protein
MGLLSELWDTTKFLGEAVLAEYLDELKIQGINDVLHPKVSKYRAKGYEIDKVTNNGMSVIMTSQGLFFKSVVHIYYKKGKVKVDKD